MQILMIILLGCFGLLGAAFGSFLGMLATRTAPKEYRHKILPTGIGGRSKCDSCGHILGVFDLVPIFSMLFSLGRCRYCKKKVDMSYSLLELISAGFTLVVYFRWVDGTSLVMAILFWIIGLVFIYLAFYDYKYWEVQTSLITIFSVALFITYLGLFWGNIVPDLNILDKVLGTVVGGGIISLLIFISRGKGLGWGDVWVLSLVGLVVGLRGLLSVFFVAVFTGAIAGILKGILVDKKIRGVIIPFVPFLSFGLILEMLFSGYIYSLLFPYPLWL